MLYTVIHDFRNSMNVIKDNNERNTLLYKNISLILFSKRAHSWYLLRDRWWDIYSERGILLSISSSRSQGVPTLTPPCKLVRDASDRLRVPRLTVILCTLSKSDRVVLISWCPSGFTPVWTRLSCLLITIWQLVKARRVTRNEPKIHGICYITHKELSAVIVE